MNNKIIAGLVFVTIAFALGTSYYMLSLKMEKHAIFSQKSSKGRFTKIYELGYWVENASGIFSYKSLFNKKSGPSGVGGLRENSLPFLEFLQNFIDKHEIRCIIDLGCGDFLSMRHIKIPDDAHYLGIDIVDELIADNSRKYSRKNIEFKAIDNLEDFEKYSSDLLIVKDTMQLWTLNQIHHFIKHILPRHRYTIIVNNFLPVSGQKEQNADITEADSRPINLQAPPFSMNIDVVLDYVGGNRYKRVYLYKSENNLEEAH